MKVTYIGPRLALKIHDFTLTEAKERMKRLFGIEEFLVGMLWICTGGGRVPNGRFQLLAYDYRQLGPPYAPVLSCVVMEGEEDVFRFRIMSGD